MEAIFLIFLFISILTLLRWLRGYFIRSSSLPPGPKGYPIIGNLLDVPTQTPWIRFAEWSKVYGTSSFRRNCHSTLHKQNPR